MTGALRRLDTIQALRGIAAIFIIIYHAFHEAGLPRASFPFRMGVDIFFVISGFIMVYTSQKWFGVRGAWKQFMARRIARIVPVYWFYTSILVVVALLAPTVLATVRFEPLHVLLSYFFIPHENPTGGMNPFLDLGWTLNYEMYFYVIFAMFLFLPIQKMLPLLTVFFGLTVAGGMYLTEEAGALYFWSRPIVMEFVAGAWIGYAYIRGVRIPDYSLLLLPLLLGVLLFHSQYENWIQALDMTVGAILFVGLAILPKGMENLSAPGVFSALGDASYTLYLSHPFTLAALAICLKFLSPWAVFWVSIPAAVIAGYILYVIVEKPLISVAKRVFILSHEKALRP